MKTKFALLMAALLLCASVQAQQTNALDVQKGAKSFWNNVPTEISVQDGIVCIEAAKPTDSAWTIDVPVNPNGIYRLSAKIKTENLASQGGAGALLNVHNLQSVRTQAVTGTKDWTDVSVEFPVEGNAKLLINCLFGGWGTATGKAWYKDVALTYVKEAPYVSPIPENWSPVVAIDATQKGTEISPYIYSQFIEHLGRCIYGGIWAEMLGDRKFYDAVGAPSSPWRPIEAVSGEKTDVKMVKENAFVGEWTPEIAVSPKQAACGIEQSGLKLKSGVDYVGYVWYKASKGVDQLSVCLSFKTDSQNKTAANKDAAGKEKGNGFTLFFKPEKFDQFVKQEFTFKYSDAKIESENEARLSLAFNGAGSAQVGCVSLMPSDNVQGMRADTLAVLKELDSPCYRWPGGNFVSGYDWKDGIGDRDRRPPRRNPAWSGIEHNDFGMDEFIAFCRYLGTEPYIAVNTGAGQVDNALKELEYANGDAFSPMGKWRKENGHEDSYNVRIWGIGNEMFGNWQIGHMPVKDYVKKNNLFYDSFKAFDKELTCVGVGAGGDWNQTFIPGAFNHMDYLSEHIYVFKGLFDVTDHVQLIPRQIENVTKRHREYQKQWPELYKDKNLRIAMDEWNYWYGPTPFGELGTRYFQKDGMGIAAGLHVFYRNSDLYWMANYAQTVNVIGCIKTSQTNAQFESTGLVLKLYRKEFGTTPVSAEIKSEQKYKAHALDVSAALTADGKYLTVSLVNCAKEPVKAKLALNGLQIQNSATRFVIADKDNDPMAFNDPDQPQRITLKESELNLTDETVVVAPMSVTLVKIPVK